MIQFIRLLCEMVVLIVCGIWGFQQWGMVGATCLPLLVMMLWAMFGSPKAPYKLEGYYGLLLALGLFSVTCYLFAHLGYTSLAFIFFIISFGVSIFMYRMDI